MVLGLRAHLANRVAYPMWQRIITSIGRRPCTYQFIATPLVFAGFLPWPAFLVTPRTTNSLWVFSRTFTNNFTTFLLLCCFTCYLASGGPLCSAFFFYYFYLSTYHVPTTDNHVFTNDDTYHATQQQQNKTDANCAMR